jgi:ubiquinone/menaquinone biosynthesis C-methylase UbiE
MTFAHDSRDLAEAYDRTSDFQLELGKRLVERLDIPEGARVLDVGCGTGRLTHWIAERGGPAIGIDPLEERILLARSRAGTATFAIGHAEDLGRFDDESFDVVCMSSVLHWIADKPRALAEARRVLRPRGRLGVTTVPHELARAGTLRLVLDSVLARYADRIDRSQLTFASRGSTTTELVTLVVDSKLELVDLQLVPHTQLHTSGESLVAFMEASAFGTFLRPVPEELRAPLRAELVDAFDARRGPDGIAVQRWSVLFTANRGL